MTHTVTRFRCPESNGKPARVFRGRAQCRWCQGWFAVKADGRVRKHFDMKMPGCSS